MIFRLMALFVGMSAMLWADSKPIPFKSTPFMEMIHASQYYFTVAKPDEAERILSAWDHNHPEARRSALFCYQRFFVALHGHGDRKKAKIMLDRLNALVKSGELDPYSVEYQSVTEGWYRFMQHTDADLPRIAHNMMAKRHMQNFDWLDQKSFITPPSSP